MKSIEGAKRDFISPTTRGMLFGGALFAGLVTAFGATPERSRQAVLQVEVPAVAGNCSVVTIRSNKLEIACPNGDAPVNRFAEGMRIDSIAHEPDGRTTWIIEDVNDPD